MKKSIIIGADGLIGHSIANQLSQRDVPLYRTSRKREHCHSNCLYLDLEVDPTNWDIPQDIDIAYFCAYIGNIKECRENPKQTSKVNISHVITLIKRFIDLGIYVLFPSTTQVFDGNTAYQKPNDSLSPLTEYGRQKSEVENALGKLPNNSIVRLSKVLGESVPLFDNWIKDLKKGKAISPFSDLHIAPLPVDFVAKCLIMIAEARLTGIFHIGGNKDISYYEIALAFAKKLGINEQLVSKGTTESIGIPRNEAPPNTTLNTQDTYNLLNVESPDVWKTIFKTCNL